MPIKIRVNSKQVLQPTSSKNSPSLGPFKNIRHIRIKKIKGEITKTHKLKGQFLKPEA